MTGNRNKGTEINLDSIDIFITLIKANNEEYNNIIQELFNLVYQGQVSTISKKIFTDTYLFCLHKDEKDASKLPTQSESQQKSNKSLQHTLHFIGKINLLHIESKGALSGVEGDSWLDPASKTFHGTLGWCINVTMRSLCVLLWLHCRSASHLIGGARHRTRLGSQRGRLGRGCCFHIMLFRRGFLGKSKGLFQVLWDNSNWTHGGPGYVEDNGTL